GLESRLQPVFAPEPAKAGTPTELVPHWRVEENEYSAFAAWGDGVNDSRGAIFAGRVGQEALRCQVGSWCVISQERGPIMRATIRFGLALLAGLLLVGAARTARGQDTLDDVKRRLKLEADKVEAEVR